MVIRMQRRLLFVDDEPLIREMYASLAVLLGKGHEIHTARSGQDALRLLTEKPFDVIVSDLAMPEMDGLEFLQEVVRGYPESAIKVERFASSIPKHEHRPAALPQGSASETEVTVILDGATRCFTLDRTTENILDAGLRQGIELPYSCKGGVCSTCRCKLVSGEVDMDVNFALEDYEVERGFILACQSYPATDKVTVDFDQSGMG